MLRMFTHTEQQLFSPPLSDGDSYSGGGNGGNGEKEKQDGPGSTTSRNNEEFSREASRGGMEFTPWGGY
ncbi:hypothetical protein TWF102_000173 [Orbilia oligospora]|uniref:Uncharacterized protein n=1 Tax=Orbilia oligospora TaxID=2813651 RepID=A0A7C8NJB5_ORBOL|nr:hypothetical protein TWF102_000173 [Orbilia oligospora]